MKKIKRITWAFIFALIAVSCVDLSHINNKIDDLEKRMQNVEGLVGQANGTIDVLRKLIDAEKNSARIVEYTETEYGYDLKMSDGKIITIKHGKDAVTPDINVTEIDGKLYWTLNGEIMRDAKGNKIIANGRNGENGLTPRLRVVDGFWEASFDGGISWQGVTDNKGDKVRAEGRDATQTLDITEDDTKITIHFNGKDFVISKVANGGNEEEKFNPDKMAIEYVSEKGINNTGEGFAKDEKSSSDLGFYKYDEAVALFKEKDFLKKYHLPSREEWMGIFPDNNHPLDFSATIDHKDLKESIKVSKDGEAVEYKAQYKSNGGFIYGIKFIGVNGDNSKRAAYRYQMVNKDNKEKESTHLKVTVRLIGNEDVTIEQVTDEKYWDANQSKDKIRYFPIAGEGKNREESRSVGEKVSYWSDSKYMGGSMIHTILFDSNKFTLKAQSKRLYLCVRPFHNL